MNTNVRIGLSILGFLLPNLLFTFLSLGGLGFISGCIAAAVIFFITKNEKAESQYSPIEKQIDGTTVILLYILSFLIPLAGFVVGAIYASKDEEHYKHVGKNCLIFSVLNIVFGSIMVVAIIAG